MRLLAVLVFGFPLFIYACSDAAMRSGTSLGVGGDGATVMPSSTTSTPVEDAAPPDAAEAGPINPIGLNGCSAYKDLTLETDAGARTINWMFTAVPPLIDGCVKIKRGQSVTWKPIPDFTTHPLTAGSKGDSPSPISNGVAATPKTILFPNEGVFPFVCGVHTGMIGVVQVVP